MVKNFYSVKKNIIKLCVRVFNWIFSSNVTIDDLAAICILSQENLHMSGRDVVSMRLILKEQLCIEPKDVELVRLVLNGMKEENLNSFRSLFVEQSNSTEMQGELLKQLGVIASMGRLDEIGDISDGVQLCYAQEGESLILERYFNSHNKGFFIDVGAHHPTRFSNTYSFYKKGWRGINIEPTPNVKALFDEKRPEDTTLSLAVSNMEMLQDFFMFREPALNTFSRELADEYIQQGFELLEVRSIDTKRLSTICEQYCIDRSIDFMSIDVEGSELSVLESNDWVKFRPKVLLIEILGFDMSHPDAFSVHTFLVRQGYGLFAKTHNTLFYKDLR